MPQYFKIEASCYYAAQSLLRDYLYLCGFERELDDFFCRLEPVAVRNDMIVIKTLGCCITKVLRFRTRRKKFPPKKKNPENEQTLPIISWQGLSSSSWLYLCKLLKYK